MLLILGATADLLGFFVQASPKLHVLEAAFGHARLRTIVIDDKPAVIIDDKPACEDEAAIGIQQREARLRGTALRPKPFHDGRGNVNFEIWRHGRFPPFMMIPRRTPERNCDLLRGNEAQAGAVARQSIPISNTELAHYQIFA